MIRWRAARGLLVGAGLVFGSLAPVSPASAAPAAACPAGTGVTVVVDFGTLGGGTQIRCVTETVGSGFEALTKAGFTFAGTTQFPGLLCRINGKPTPAQESCHTAPPSNRYWAYWSASQPGGSWAYNDMGAGNRVPPPGSVEGWAFSDGCRRTPGSAPCASLATTTTARPAGPSTTDAPGVGGTGGLSPSPSSPGAPTTTDPASPSTVDAPDDVARTTTSAVGERAPLAGEEGDPAELASAPGAGDGGSSAGGGGSPAGVASAVVVLVVLLGAGAWRRRSTRGVGS